MSHKYILTLTHDERRAIDFVGHRYWNGDDLYQVLSLPSTKFTLPTSVPMMDDLTVDDLWEQPCDITFEVEPAMVTMLREKWEEENGLCPLFSPELEGKIEVFFNRVIV